ncbi:nuclease-related domain-containing protein [Bacillus sp. Marseille-P3661]|uniref:nuclease-related domain-containing protein n=1 Tax=Bacillus sp. Marseille-P3661 TaxID=1936234 RepID=UPI000C84C128|nr:nuclease-related domain-containing protein [Bacillus sp. Marseille-P3661]
MLIKSRYEPKELKILRALKNRMDLSASDLNYYQNLDKGFKGELAFDERLKNLSDDWLILNDLLLEQNKTHFQVDTLLISQDTNYLFEIKYFDVDLYIEDDRWYTVATTEIKNPINQLSRTESLLRRQLQNLGLHAPIESYVVLMNPESYIYKAPRNLPIIFPAHLGRLLNKLHTKSSKLNAKHLKLANQLVSLHIKESLYTNIPPYTYEQLEKGISCLSCDSFKLTVVDEKLLCNVCGNKELVTPAILRNVEEFQYLFPDRKITTNTIHEWCKVIGSKKTIRRVLANNFKLLNKGRSSYYVKM